MNSEFGELLTQSVILRALKTAKILIALSILICGQLLAEDPPAEQSQRPQRPGRFQRVFTLPGIESISPTHANVKYGPYDRNVMDVWLAKSETPTPVLISIHGGGFRAGTRASTRGC